MSKKCGKLFSKKVSKTNMPYLCQSLMEGHLLQVNILAPTTDCLNPNLFPGVSSLNKHTQIIRKLPKV